MHSVKKNLQKLLLFKKSSKKKRQKILEKADKDFVQCLCECAENTLNSNVPLSKAQYKKLARHKQKLRRLSQRGEDWKKKKSFINQTGGFIVPLIGPILAVLLQAALA